MANLLLTGCVILSCLLIQGTNGMDCTLGTSDNAIDKFIHSCPRLIIDSSDESYCCYSYNTEGHATTMRCCTFWDFIVSTVGNILLPIIIVVLVISLLISCICCLCCRKSRSGRVLQPARVITVPTYVTMPAGASVSSQPLLAGY